MTGNIPRKYFCPQCRAEIEWRPENPYRPFCSERCKLIDLGCWADESYRVPVQEESGVPEDGVPPVSPD